MLLGGIGKLGEVAVDGITGVGAFVRFTLAVLLRFVRMPGTWLRRHRLAPQLFRVGVASIPVVGLTGAFIGMVMALESYAEFAAIGQEGRLGAVINISVIKQIGPVLAAVMVAGRVGGALAAELGAMRVTEQIDAMRAMAADPLAHLIVPRVVACVVMTPVLTVFSNLLGVGGGWLIAVKGYGVPDFDYWWYSADFITWWEPVSGLFKSMCFGGVIGLIACHRGLSCRPGATGVGRATTESFVLSFLAIIALNLALARLLNGLAPFFLS